MSQKNPLTSNHRGVCYTCGADTDWMLYKLWDKEVRISERGKDPWKWKCENCWRNESVTVGFAFQSDMDKGLDILIHNSSDGWSGVGQMAIRITRGQYELLNRSNISCKELQS